MSISRPCSNPQINWRRNFSCSKNFSFTLTGEVERLLKEYRQNQELVRQIGGHYYQIIYPVQLRHHEKMGISTREVGGSKVWSSLGKRNVLNTNTVCHLHLSHPPYIHSPFIECASRTHNNVRLTQYCNGIFSLPINIFFVSRAQTVDMLGDKERGYVRWNSYNIVLSKVAGQLLQFKF